jgi:hypothetical protein
MDAVCWFLTELKATDKVIDQYRKGKHPDFQAFEDTMKTYESKQAFEEQRKKEKSELKSQVSDLTKKLHGGLAKQIRP